ncbi:MAG: DUF503 domain-containing protein [Firmicutes bacterium]|jgi:uncharacterized protein YlxP (DUF503 family)|nr:DUF503 domain-containing protein [Bacillota bacterium]
MTVGTGLLTLYFHGVQSLKEKRSILKSVLMRARNKFNAAIAEIDDHDLWQKATVGIAVIANSSVQAEKELRNIIRFIESDPRLEVTFIDIEMR